VRAVISITTTIITIITIIIITTIITIIIIIIKDININMTTSKAALSGARACGHFGI